MDKTYKCYRCGKELDHHAVCNCHFDSMYATCGICGEAITSENRYKCKCKIVKGID